ncbi:hypothetical protein UY416_11885 [Paenibacillus polymyxa]|uniref:hypothetical protein n=1 Tax=Paenibacillus polymyxa TaxID=1406 RepID=UPI002AB36A65|nr:hypothetical protein [Paenibacillus polymyxa]MDY8046987.1 hypothetical protein [Paenibacillus polymyxa]
MKRIVQELKDLPKTADGWREIYTLSIPEWVEQEGKDRIRSHMEWIVSNWSGVHLRMRQAMYRRAMCARAWKNRSIPGNCFRLY